MSEANICIAAEDPRQAGICELIVESDAYMRSLYPAGSNHLIDAEALAAPDTVFLTGRRDGILLGSIAYRVVAPGHAEMKRLFVREHARGAGIGRKLLMALEDEARRRGIDRISLETGIKQPEAIGLYRACGYQGCNPFGDYRADPLSLFMTKRL